MQIDWESTFTEWAKSPSSSEQKRCQNAISIVRNAIAKHNQLKNRRTYVFAQGSFRNRVNVRQDSDVDIGVLCDQTFYYDLPSNFTEADFGITPATYHFSTFKAELTRALRDHLGESAVTPGNKAIKVKETSYHVQADVVPLFEHRQYFANRGIRYGVTLIPDNGGQIDNYPEKLLSHWPDIPLHYENGVAKNDATNRRFKSVVRIIKKLRNVMDEAGNASAKPIPSYLIECLVWNVPNHTISGTSWLQIVRDVLHAICEFTKDGTTYNQLFEVDNIKFLFHGSQPWTREQANRFAESAWALVGYE